MRSSCSLLESNLLFLIQSLHCVSQFFVVVVVVRLLPDSWSQFDAHSFSSSSDLILSSPSLCSFTLSFNPTGPLPGVRCSLFLLMILRPAFFTWFFLPLDSSNIINIMSHGMAFIPSFFSRSFDSHSILSLSLFSMSRFGASDPRIYVRYTYTLTHMCVTASLSPSPAPFTHWSWLSFVWFNWFFKYKPPCLLVSHPKIPVAMDGHPHHPHHHHHYCRQQGMANRSVHSFNSRQITADKRRRDEDRGWKRRGRRRKKEKEENWATDFSPSLIPRCLLIEAFQQLLLRYAI